MEKNEIVRYAGEIMRFFGTSNPFSIAKSLGIQVEYRRYGKSVKGYYRKIFDKLYIIINSNYSRRSQKIICAHELGHALLHTYHSDRIASMAFKDYDTDGLEHEANIFAAALLIDQDELSMNIAVMGNYMLKGLFEDNMTYTGKN